MGRIISLPLLIILLLHGFPNHGRGEEGRVAVNILSRHVRLVSEGAPDAIRFEFFGKKKIYDRENNSEINTGFLSLHFREGEWMLEHDEGLLSGNFHLTVQAEGGASGFHIRLPGETRNYPLPLVIRKSSGIPEIIISENIGRYSLHSALAEYGIPGPGGDEALKALTAVIRARSLSRIVKKTDHGYDFCDLTHCQVYRGAIKSPGYPEEMAERIGIIKNYNNELLFHSRCGGEIFDIGIFTGKKQSAARLKDRLYRDGIDLCASRENCWERMIPAGETVKILEEAFPGLKVNKYELYYEKKKSGVKVSSVQGERNIPAETFRLALNRKMGWNFIKSNNYAIQNDGTGEGRFIFKGCGLGHGVGLCQHGALELSRRGYSWGEILHHYYPGIELTPAWDPLESPPEFSYCVFNLNSGIVEKSSHKGFILRRFPPGSLWKLITALYLARERQDLFNDYRFNCAGRSPGNDGLPEKCWLRKGHGSQRLEEALSNSCNLYFASLYDKIALHDFRKFYKDFCKMLDIEEILPEISTVKDYANFLAGIDFRFTLSVRDFFKIAVYIGAENYINREAEDYRNKIKVQYRLRILKALMNSFIHGTARFPAGDSGKVKKRYSVDFLSDTRERLKVNVDGIWGKTSTIIDGTNIPLSYGIFMGGYREKGVLVYLRDGTGHFAAQWGKLLLMREYSL